ncbi:cell surface receptor IPT/TIG domain-containing protein [Pseudoalteromonas carrageenovora]|uniref:cell surface receptor IPT/TIG domain-containing protein n=1 Tax=Pseudoalteromonas carrageenovora TaxID=227 RepID=UPI002FCFCEA7
MKIPLLYLSLLSFSIAFSSLNFITPAHAKTDQSSSDLGTWQNKDEDVDGVPDELDDYLFDNSRSKFIEVQDSEPNDNPSVATPLAAGIPFRVKGAISNKGDNGDLYRFKGKEGDFVSALVTYESESFAPKAYFSDESGLAINSSLIHFSKENKTFFVTVIIPKDGLFHLGVIDSRSGGNPSFKYQVDVFYDEDIDGIPDNKERALGILPNSQDTDKDGIPDFYEYYVDASIGIDFDSDGILNMLDEDSDGDAISDKFEGYTDPDEDGLYNFIDLDSDDDSILDSQEKVNDKGLPLDSDYDDIADFLDLDNDGDYILDIHDSDPYAKVESISMDSTPFIQISSVSSLINGVTTKEVLRGNDIVVVNGMNMESAKTPILVIYSQDNIYNFIPTYSKAKYRFKLNIPEGKHRAFLYVDDLKTNDIYISSYSNDVPLILGPSFVMLKRGTNFTLNVTGATQGTKVILGGKTIVPNNISATSITFHVPNKAVKGTLHLLNYSGKSNSIFYNF